MQRATHSDSGRSVLEFLSFEADGTLSQEIMPATPFRSPAATTAAIPMQGVLWKRRDVFRNRWRPRWFVLHPDQKVLTYYLLSNQDEQVVSGNGSTTSSLSTPSRRSTSRNSYTTPSATTHMGSPATTETNNRRRTFSESSANTIDCDVVPRGTIYLLGSTVEANEALTRPQEDLYALTITDHETATHCHLAARDPEMREEWILRIRTVCRGEDGESRTTITPSRSMRRKRKGRGKSSSPTTTTATPVRNPKPAPAVESPLRHEPTDNAPEMAVEAVPMESPREKDILILLGPLVLYKFLTMVSLTRFAALVFVATSAMVMRWILIQHLSKRVRFLPDHESLFPTGSICCRFSADISKTTPISKLLVDALTKAIQKQPSLASKKYPLLPPFYSTTVVFLDLSKQSIDDSSQSKTVLERLLGPACRIVMTSSEHKPNADHVHVDLNIADCPITVSVSRTQADSPMVNISINIQSTNVGACQAFAEAVRASIS